MDSFDLNYFTQHLMAETLFYDEEFGVLGIVSLIDATQHQERYVCSFDPEDEAFVLEKGTDWETGTPEEAIGYAIATNLEEHARVDTPDEAAGTLLSLAREENLLPSMSLFFDMDEAE